jgi:hypothetical protein
LLTLNAGVDDPPSQVFDVVDIFNGITGTWSTAVLSVARTALAATSLPNHGLAIFAGGTGVGTSYYIEFELMQGALFCSEVACEAGMCFVYIVLF